MGALFTFWGCAKEQVVEPDFVTLGITKEESSLIASYLNSPDTKLVYRGLEILQNNPKVTFLHLDKVIEIRDTSKDSRITIIADDLLTKIRS